MAGSRRIGGHPPDLPPTQIAGGQIPAGIPILNLLPLLRRELVEAGMAGQAHLMVGLDGAPGTRSKMLEAGEGSLLTVPATATSVA
jgi:hypothetical protein